MRNQKKRRTNGRKHPSSNPNRESPKRLKQKRRPKNWICQKEPSKEKEWLKKRVMMPADGDPGTIVKVERRKE